MLLANDALSLASFNSTNENPLPSFWTALYLLVYPLTTGRRSDTGLGEVAMDE